MTELFPSIQPEIEESTVKQLPLCREIAWDFAAGVPVFSGGRPVEVYGAEAVRVWIWKALRTARCRYDIYTWDYGCELENLMGQPFTAKVKQSEAARYIEETLETNPYITSVSKTDVTFEGTKLSIRCAVSTVYGEVEIHV